MKAIEINKTGGPEVLEVKDISLDKPGPDQVTIKQKAIGLNYIDTYHRSGLYPLKLPIGLGLEGAGIITDIGENIKDFKVGDKISYAGMPLGSYCSHRNYPIKNLVKVPDGIDLEIAATLMTKGLTTFYLLHKTYPVKSGETILFHAAAGGVGQIFGQWAKSLGCSVIGTVGSDEKVNIAKENGYDHVINYNKEDFAKKVLDKVVSVRFDTNVNNLDWNFKAKSNVIDVKVGQVNRIEFEVENLGNETTHGVASFNVSPASFGKYYSKLGCFCFEKQELKAGEKAIYVMTFYLDPDLVNDPTTKNLQDVTMSYTFFSTDYYKQS